ncbi:uncharacterized protein [Littorina saxatilis]|uniref:Uncharacterized protein n=1 Tax=Littorina saxatilis TaxID=31220 RepID=A0AAN9FYH3_9CAEN
MGNVRSADHKYTKLKEAEENLDTMVKNMKNSYNGGTYIPTDNFKEYVGGTFDFMKQATLDALGDSWGSNEGSNNNAQIVGTTDALQPDKLNNLLLPRHPEEIGFPGIRPTTPVISSTTTDEYSVITLRREDDATPAEPEADRADEPTTEGAQPTTEDEEFQQEVLSMLSRMSNKLIGFFRWLKTKVEELASKAWQKVCEAFTAMCTFLSNVAERIRGSGHRANYSKMHMA